MATIQKRYDFVLYFDVLDGNPNGDPDAGNLPRIDPETGHGLVTDVCLKRKVRNYVGFAKNYQRPFDIFVKEKAILNNLIEEAHQQPQVATKEKGDKTEAARQWMCSTYYDIRTFGAVMTTGKNAGQVRGPVQLTFARSVEPVVALEHTITRMAVATEEEAARQEGENRTMGRKFTIPYGLYRTHGFISPFLAAQTGFSEEDLELLWMALEEMFDHDRSAARGLMSTRAVIIFEHSSPLGSAPAHELFRRVSHRCKTNGPARSFEDYEILLDNRPIEQRRIVVSVS
ncbi:MAG: type I-C CRISPR-associated protein Cas7/Csd2 [Bacteroidota bacterium]|nr:type I-C CRISPR-associated protein Cas7/Csd2 [Candidatus Kapabacteria bacterium]MCS7303376.1 type I-C CRISPR-associated protein Cas7/Csd2 [Candidatus Kapabacteria bacterium]MCX7937762.1 type I-C CRISPR-associated protein Cas7/Csd2 [Chlorobiota bacterium]MDW8075952.1 type I-C CRISPR-associated protein Cas7/Csd2 [Bacteroidota bacterium]MDW8272546.1 type I-C CRISPR-associated protein Cas7/Csd2 [Bacteroidota bacterium]